MSRLDDYRSALRVADETTSADALARILEEGGPEFATFVVDHGLGPSWHERTGRAEFRDSRLAAEGYYMNQASALAEIDQAFEKSNIAYAVIKGAANRLLLYDNPAIRSSHDIDLLVRRADRLSAAQALAAIGFEAMPKSETIGHQLVLTRSGVDIDLHWALLREGRLRFEPTNEMLERRRRLSDLWMLGAEDTVFVLLVHPAFAKHLAGRGMGLNRVFDIVFWLEGQRFDWDTVVDRLKTTGVTTAAWATLRWVEMLASGTQAPGLKRMQEDLRPGPLRTAWVERWLVRDLSERMAGHHWFRLIGLTALLHDTPRDAIRALLGRFRAHGRRAQDIAEFEQALL